ncbi:MAG: hypothetical protein QM778_21715 [Myxococcales bacterium]
MRKQISRAALVACAATCGAAVLAPGALAAPTYSKSDQGLPTCFYKPGVPTTPVLPGLDGLPRWPEAAADAEDQANSDWKARTWAAIDDPRWGAWTPIRFPGSSPNQATVGYRVMASADGHEVAVQIQNFSDANGSDGKDYVVFGVADADGKHAWGLKVILDTVRGAHVKADNFESYKYDAAIATADKWTFDSWVTDANSLISYWANNNSWTVEIRLNVANLAGGSTTDFGTIGGRFFVGAHVFKGIGTNPDGSTKDLVADYGTANVYAADCTNGGARCSYPTNTSVSEFPYSPENFTPLAAALNSACSGMNVDESGIQGVPLNDDGTEDTTNLNKFWVIPSKNNRVTFTPDYSAIAAASRTTVVPANSFKTTFRIANWGAVATKAGWNELPNSPKVNTTVAAPATVVLDCPNDGGDPADKSKWNICGKVQSPNIQVGVNHQCVQVSVDSVDSLRPVPFTNTSAFRNMFYRTMSEVDEVAEVSVKGLNAILGDAPATREVYLHVVKRQLTDVGTPTRVDVNGLLALRDQADPFYSNPAVSCSVSGAACVDIGTGGTCLNPLTDDGLCGEGEVLFPGGALFGDWCIPLQAEPCAVPAAGGYDRTKTSMTPGQKLRSAFPNYEVYPYYDSGRVRTINGKKTAILIPMPSFGLYLTHEGDFFGYNSDIEEETAPASGTTPAKTKPITRVGPDFYKISVPSEGSTRLHVKLSTQDTLPDPFYQIVGTATPLPLGLGNVTITGIARTANLDLSKANVVVKKILSEGGKDLVAGVGTGITLTRNAGATPGLATFSKAATLFGNPAVTMQAVNLPLIGQTIAMQVVGASVGVPASCPLSIGFATLKTEFTITSGTQSFTAYGNDSWGCLPGQLLNVF